MAEFPYHRSLRLQNFTVFRDASFEFVPGINAVIGANGAGKTHLLKVLYAYQYGHSRRGSGISTPLSDVFRVENLGHLRRIQNEEAENNYVEGEWQGLPWRFMFLRSDSFNEDGERLYGAANLFARPKMPRPIFIPAIDMMAHTKRFIATYDEYNIDFDQTYRDIVAALLSPERREKLSSTELHQTLSRVVGGDIEEQGERFYLRTPQGRFPMPLVAEGLRKIATLQQLLKNGFLRPGDTLFWDEPEVNLNPTLMDEVVAVLLALARSGVQIFLATHSYVILKELDLQSGQNDSVRYFSLEPSDDGTIVHSADDYSQLRPNAISEQFDSLYDRELTRATGRTRRK